MMRWWWNLVRFGFRLLYNELAFTYDTVSKVVSLGAWRCWQRSGIKYLNAQRSDLILELAHGTGDLQIDLKAAGYRTVGYDLSPAMGKIARRKLAKNRLSADLVRGMAQRLPFSTASFKAVISTFPTDFIFAGDTLQEAHRVLLPGGVFVIVPNGVFTSGGLARRFLEWLYRVTGQRDDAGTIMQQQIVAFFATHGFDVTFHQEACPRSLATVLVARKKDYTSTAGV
ncbi:MAG: class I SAM-dependent methyltransferase [bacterium]|nr:class I SAM-dependent methyltransferase [bacterium]